MPSRRSGDVRRGLIPGDGVVRGRRRWRARGSPGRCWIACRSALASPVAGALLGVAVAAAGLRRRYWSAITTAHGTRPTALRPERRRPAGVEGAGGAQRAAASPVVLAPARRRLAHDEPDTATSAGVAGRASTSAQAVARVAAPSAAAGGISARRRAARPRRARSRRPGRQQLRHAGEHGVVVTQDAASATPREVTVSASAMPCSAYGGCSAAATANSALRSAPRCAARPRPRACPAAFASTPIVERVGARRAAARRAGRRRYRGRRDARVARRQLGDLADVDLVEPAT